MALSRLLPLAAGLLLPAAVARSPQLEAEDTVRVDPESGFLRDGQGRVRIFRGMNIVYKEDPWYPPSANFTTDDSVDAKTIDLMRKWGFNVVRLGVMWPGVEPAKGQIDESYLKAVTGLSGDLAKRGIYTLVDLHQDVGSRRMCGEGFPEFYVDELAADDQSAYAQAAKFPAPQMFDIPMNDTFDNKTGFPPLFECLKRGFAGYYLTDKVGALWGELYRPGSDMNQGFMRYWGAVAKAFVNSPQVVGYELLNEPSGYCLEPGTVSCLDAAKTLFGNSVETTKLTPMYQAAAQVIREVDKGTPIFYESTVVPKLLGGPFDAPPLSSDPQQGLGYHIYCAAGDGDNIISGALCGVTQDLYTRLYFGFLRKNKGVAGFMTEFGAIGGNPKELEHLNRLMDLMDGEFQSWTYWMLKKYHDFTTANAAESLYDEQGNLNVPKLKALSRTYAQAIAGTPTKMKYDWNTGAFELRFEATVEGTPTVVYLNQELHYPAGFDVEVSPTDCLTQAQGEENYLEFTLPAGAGCKGSEVTISIHRKSEEDVLVI